MTAARPRLLYYNGPWEHVGRRVRVSYLEPLGRLLAQDFELISVSGNRDLRADVRAHRPDLILFHSGCTSPHEPEIEISHVDECLEIPRIGIVFRDPLCPSRLVAMNRLRRWRVEQVFTFSRPTDSLDNPWPGAIYVPWWIDDRVFRDYAETKRFPITLAGSGWLNRRFFYSWRYPVLAALTPRFPIYHVPAGQSDESADPYVGEDYARMLNRSVFSAGCGSMARFITLKLLEIPACRSCLIAEETAAIKAMGFHDGENCVFATPDEVVDKVQALLDDPTRLRAVTDAGFAMVHARHTQRNRRMFAEWFSLRREKGPEQKIVQVSPLEPLQLVARTAEPGFQFPTENPMTEKLRSGFELLQHERWAEALREFEAVIEMIPYVAEAQLGAAIAELRLGHFESGAKRLTYNVLTQRRQSAERHPDVITHAFLSAILMRLKKWEDVFVLLCARPGVRHPALNSARWLSAQMRPEFKRRSSVFAVEFGDNAENTARLHSLPERDFEGWKSVWEEIQSVAEAPVKNASDRPRAVAA